MTEKKVSIHKKIKELYWNIEDFPISPDFPNNLTIELTNGCNLKCKMCYNKDMKRKVGFMSEKLFRDLIDQAVDLKIENLALYTVGESMLHPKIFDFIRIAKDKGIKYVYLTTNGMLLDSKKNQEVIDSGLDSIKFSIDSASKETYEDIRVGSSWEKLINNIRVLKELRERSDSNLRIFASFLVTNENYEDLFRFQEQFGGLIDETMFSFMCNQGGHTKTDTMMSKKMKDNLDRLVLPKEKWHPCAMLWNRFVVNYDGTMTVCCMDFESDIISADLNKVTLKEAWNNEKMKEFRMLHKESRFDEMPLCEGCDAIKRDDDVYRELTLEVMNIVNGPNKGPGSA